MESEVGNCSAKGISFVEEEIKPGTIVYRKTTYIGDNSTEEVFEGDVDDVIRLVRAVFEMEKDDGESFAQEGNLKFNLNECIRNYVEGQSIEDQPPE